MERIFNDTLYFVQTISDTSRILITQLKNTDFKDLIFKTASVFNKDKDILSFVFEYAVCYG